LQYLIDAEKARIKKEGERPRGGRHEAALSEVARQQGITVEDWPTFSPNAIKKRTEKWSLRRNASSRSEQKHGRVRRGGVPDFRAGFAAMA
jgi:hypothetical protein